MIEEGKILTPDYMEQLKDRLVTKDYKEEWIPILRYRKEDGDSVPLVAKKELLVIAGEKKARKSLLISSICASRFVESQRKRVLGFELEMDQPILYFDTEMSMARIAKNRKKYLKVAGFDWDKDDPNFIQYSLKGYSPHTMVQMIRSTIEKMVRDDNPPGVVIIDQIADLLPGRDENDKLAASDIIDHINDWVDLSGALVIASIHLNRANGLSNGKMGSLIDQKADCQLKLTLVDKTWETELSQPLAREERMPDLIFSQETEIDRGGYHHYGLPILIDEKINLNNKKYFTH